MGSGRKTIEPGGKAHKRADSGVVVGKGARIRSLVEAWRRGNKQSFVLPRNSELKGLFLLGGRRCNADDAMGLLCSPAGASSYQTKRKHLIFYNKFQVKAAR